MAHLSGCSLTLAQGINSEQSSQCDGSFCGIWPKFQFPVCLQPSRDLLLDHLLLRGHSLPYKVEIMKTRLLPSSVLCPQCLKEGLMHSRCLQLKNDSIVFPFLFPISGPLGKHPLFLGLPNVLNSQQSQIPFMCCPPPLQVG